MSRRLRLAILILVVIVIDGWAWRTTYKIHTAPSPEKRLLESEHKPIFEPSSVVPIGDNYQQVFSLNGEWQYKQTGSEIGEYPSTGLDTRDWHTMEIPQNWYLAGLNYHGVIWFRKSFSADSNWQGRSIQLQFGGVDYFADVWLNGNKIGQHEGYFQPFTFDVTDTMNFGSDNDLVVRVESPYEEYKAVWPFRKTLIKGIFSHSATRPGGAWTPAGQEFNTGGIWNDVSLVVNDYLTINDIQIGATWPTTQTVGIDPTVNAWITINNHADTTVQADITLKFIPQNHDGAQIFTPITSTLLSRGQTIINLSGSAVNPMLWWTWDRGSPNLYTARVEISLGSNILAEKETTFGFRQIHVQDDWTWTLNGQRFFPRGSNYTSSQWLSETNTVWFERDVQLIRGANLNFIRLPAHVEPGGFYRMTDEAGILVWQEFPLQWGYSDAPAFIDEAQSQLEDMISLLYNHPSIAVWCMHNESPSDTPWLGEKDNDYVPSQNRRLDTLLFNLASDLDPTRHIHKNSGYGDNHIYIGWKSGKWTNFGDWSMDGDSVQSPVSQSSSPKLNPPGAPFVTEYGAQALPNIDMMSMIFLPEELNYASGEIRDRWEFHNFQPTETFNIAQINQGESIEEFINNSQVYQGNLIKFATENFRRAKYNPMKGIFYTMFVDPWPSITHSVLDHNRQPKLGYYELQTAMQPILPSIFPSKPVGLDGRAWVYEDPDDFSASLWVINDTLDAFPDAKLNWKIETEAGQRVTFGEIGVDVSADSSMRIWTISSNRIIEGAYKIAVILSTKFDQVLGENHFSFIIHPQIEETNE